MAQGHADKVAQLPGEQHAIWRLGATKSAEEPPAGQVRPQAPAPVRAHLHEHRSTNEGLEAEASLNGARVVIRLSGMAARPLRWPLPGADIWISGGDWHLEEGCWDVVMNGDHPGSISPAETPAWQTGAPEWQVDLWSDGGGFVQAAHRAELSTWAATAESVEALECSPALDSVEGAALVATAEHATLWQQSVGLPV